ncbi:sulfite exporter TauE/SafE family protein [Winogradskyella immobilis]|uniref:Probable membrane transporter protein n=1 Tax=Winogradskyella immobilis TaxID=2816852 RepID=A0ABS8EML6_9FLAO|nr:sulfite exporter TauE/SafE family protein [Winogradskyella immobilis]MCC1484454.1 sulfite exporter TauE/SafE family protein [Winogradskyella immobilis]MCG0016546.1 sulfite exporter TauE/SafE family protein [Winogradskyella immobilis]
MDIATILGYFGAVIAGLVLGLIGGGGSILSVPILVYLFGLNPLVATAYSLFVVGVTSAIGAFQNFKKGFIDLKTAIIFAIPAFIAVYLTRRFLVPIIPDVVFSIGNFKVTNTIFIMLLFAIVMLLASLSMIRGRKDNNNTVSKVTYNFPLIALEGILVGLLTGLVGAGGGFLIIPALVLLAKLPMKKAIGTSLFIIAIKSLIGFLGDLNNIDIDWVFLLSFTALSIIGIILGVYLSRYISGKKLKKGFGYFILVMAFYIICKELI